MFCYLDYINLRNDFIIYCDVKLEVFNISLYLNSDIVIIWVKKLKFVL